MISSKLIKTIHLAAKTYNNQKLPTILENTINIEAIHCTRLMNSAIMQLSSQLLYPCIINSTRTFLADCILCANYDDRNLAHITKSAETCVEWVNIRKTQLIVQTEYQQDSIQPMCKLPITTWEFNLKINLSIPSTPWHGTLKITSLQWPAFQTCMTYRLIDTTNRKMWMTWNTVQLHQTIKPYLKWHN